jgi:hypothetical protein
MTVFFVQETIISILYVLQTRKHLNDSSVLARSTADEHGSHRNRRQVLYHLVYGNLVVIGLDTALLAVEFANLFYIQGALKPCVYGVKLRVEFFILNQLISNVQRSSYGSMSRGTSGAASAARYGSRPIWRSQEDENQLETLSQTSQRPILGREDLGSIDFPSVSIENKRFESSDSGQTSKITVNKIHSTVRQL